MQVDAGGVRFKYYHATLFDEFDRVTGITFGNNTSARYGYYGVSKRLNTIVTALPGGSPVQNLAHSYDAVGNITAIADRLSPSGSASSTITLAGYDSLNRLLSVQWAGAGTKSFTYAAIGNLLANGEAGGGRYVYNTANPAITARPHAVKFANGVYYTYDLNGNMVFRGKQTMGYDVYNRLTSVTNVDGTVITFGYADDGQRLWEQKAAGAHIWVGDNYEQLIGGKVLYHVMAAGRRVCTFEPAAGGTTYDPITEEFYYYHPDHLGSSTIMTDRNAAGAIQHYVYSAYGRDQYVKSTTAFAISHRFTGQVLDVDTGLYYYNARYYDPELGRFIQPNPRIQDLSNPQSYNRYSYCVNDPLRYTDPTGLDYWGDVGGMFVGYYQAGASVVSGTAFMVAHPIVTAQGVGTAVAHPVNTVSAIGSGIAKDWNSGAQGQGRVVGGALLAVGMALAPGAEAGNLSKVGEVANVGEKVEQAAATAEKVGAATENAGNTADQAAQRTAKLSKVQRSTTTEEIGGGKFTKTTDVRPGRGPGQSRAEYVRYKNQQGETIRTYKDTYDRANNFQHRKPLRGGPEGRPQN